MLLHHLFYQLPTLLLVFCILFLRLHPVRITSLDCHFFQGMQQAQQCLFSRCSAMQSKIYKLRPTGRWAGGMGSKGSKIVIRVEMTLMHEDGYVVTRPKDSVGGQFYIGLEEWSCQEAQKVLMFFQLKPRVNWTRKEAIKRLRS
ncbi:hypothetical protein B0T12DRAFT_470739 [Alternaria alternata]|nr:hypothetical protein B0T12DRAFT_470739 [Alternaria alternata]